MEDCHTVEAVKERRPELEMVPRVTGVTGSATLTGSGRVGGHCVKPGKSFVIQSAQRPSRVIGSCIRRRLKMQDLELKCETWKMT